MSIKSQIEMLETYCDFSDPSAVYILILLPRKKENLDQTEREKLQKRSRYVVSNMEDVKFALDEFNRYVSLYPELTFRIYVSVNRRSLMKGMLNFQKKLIDFNQDLINGNKEIWTPIAKLGSEFKSVLAKKEAKFDKNYHFDIDITNDQSDVFATESVDDFVKRVGEITDVIYFGRSKSGYALVTKPCDPNKLPKNPDIEMKNDGYLFVAVLNDK